MDKKEIRLQKLISECGEASRRKAEELITAGRVRVNGNVATLGQTVLPGRDKVTIDGRPIRAPRSKTYIALNKPRGYVTTMSDELERRTVTELVEGAGKRLYPVGRLDKDSEGLLLLTDDGEFANALTHPRHHVPKLYHVSVRPAVTESQLVRLETGIEIDGKMTAPAKAKLLRQEDGRAVIELTLYEGRNRQIRKMCEALGLEVARLSRVGIGSVKLGGLKPGTWRALTPAEVSSLLHAAGLALGTASKAVSAAARRPAKRPSSRPE